MKSCASCRHWKATEIAMPGLDNPLANAVLTPDQKRELHTQQEMYRASHALCTWPATQAAQAFFRTSPFWMANSVAAGGILTDEKSGFDCAAWEARDTIDIKALAKGKS